MIGAHVKYVDTHGVEHDALVTRAFIGSSENPIPFGECAVNLVYVSSDSSQYDQYGQQIVRANSIAAKMHMSAPANYYYVVDQPKSFREVAKEFIGK